MPQTRVVLYCDEDGFVPFLEWFETLPQRAQSKCVVRMERLAELGHELRRPEADYLGDGIYELRAKHSGINYRVLYFFHGKLACVLSHGFMKQQAKVPKRELRKAVERKKLFKRAPDKHTYEGEVG